ncbi:hypothetical protein [Deinococcus rubellus]|uniref:Carboxypeptidase regulatory-like domain-containing protein n=1 Tax=Deinococcus rubellus TaxID=1889240 RepID=A0ABY5YE70_9DEIO|nr:hypothetical protein [Deinococcus rubellus]UWX63236.1 hypothetical protein N0D28_10800 [Deinococcus rubellus]
MISSLPSSTRLFAVALGLPLLLAACQGRQATPAPSLYSVSGTLTGLNPSATTTAQVFTPWTGGAGTMQAVIGKSVLSTGTVDGSGSFSLTLPATLPDSDLNSFNTAKLDLGSAHCAGALIISNQAALTAVVDFQLVTAASSRFAAPIDVEVSVNADGSGQSTEVDTLLIYSDSVTTLSGQQQCIENGSTLVSTYDINLKAGYNTINQTLVLKKNSGGTTNRTISFANGKSPPRWAAGPASATPLSLKTNSSKTLFH